MNFRFALLLIALAAVARFLPHPPNFTPLGAMAIFGAAYFRRQSMMLVLPFVALFVSDLVLNNVVYAEFYGGKFVWLTSWWLYAAFALVGCSGLLWFRAKVKMGNVLGASLTASLIFFTVSNFSVWLESTMYPQTSAGLLACFTAGLPFLGNTVLGDLFFSALLFGVYEAVTRKSTLPQIK